MKAVQRKSVRIDLLVLAAYGVVLLLYLIASQFPQARLWGVNWWSFFPAGLSYVLFFVTVIAGVGLYLFQRKLSDEPPKSGSKSRYVVFTLAGSAALILCFIVFRNATHFLGDGYQLISRLASGAPPLKSWEIGALKVEYALYSVLDGTTIAGALLSFQIISIAGGAIFLAAVAMVSWGLFERTAERVLFFLGIATGGYMLLYFGYVENYPLFVLAVMVYTLCGLLAIKGRLNRWWLLAPLCVALVFHVFAVTLVPSLIYLFVRDTRLGRGFGRLETQSKLLSGFLLLVVAGAVYVYVYSHNFFFRFAVLPLLPDTFTIKGDTLFSPGRLLDLLNLAIMLAPGLLVLAIAGLRSGRRAASKRSDLTFLIVLTVSAWGAVFLFNPKLGLPRDWDLFSFAGAPLVVLLYYGVLKSQMTVRLKTTAVSLAVLLSAVSLASRVAVFADTNRGIAAFKSYSLLDPLKNRNTYMTLVESLEDKGDTAGARVERSEYERRYPEAAMCQRAGKLVTSGKYAEALPYCLAAIRIDPTYADAYANLGLCFADQGRLDSAVILCKIADGLNPHSAVYMNNLGTVYLRNKDYVRAREYYLKALSLDSTITNSIVNLSLAYFLTGDPDRSFDYLKKLKGNSQVPANYFLVAGDKYCEGGRYDIGRGAYELALDRGLDSATVLQHIARYQQLQK